MSNRIEAARSWISSLTKEEMLAKLKEAKARYQDSPQLKKQLEQVMKGSSPKEQKLAQASRLYLLTMYLEEHPEEQ